MTIKEVEQQTGLPRSVIRFYEKEALINPERNGSNGYREYSGQDVEALKKIAFLRTLDISIEDIKKIMTHQVELHRILSAQKEALNRRVEELEEAKTMCVRLAEDRQLDIDNLKVEKYTSDLEEYWDRYESVFKMDSVSFISMFGGTLCWTVITALAFIAAICFYPILPEKIPVQWSGGEISSSVPKPFIFIYPLICVVCRCLLKPMIRMKAERACFLQSGMVADYTVNFLCFVALTVEIFTALYLRGIVRSVTAVLLVDAVALIGVLGIGLKRMAAGAGKV